MFIPRILRRRSSLLLWMTILLATPLLAQVGGGGDVVSTAGNRIANAFLGPWAQFLSLIGLCYCGAQLMWGDGRGKGAMIGVLIGCTILLGAAQLKAWLWA